MNLTSIKERIAISDAFTAEERDFILDAINTTPQALAREPDTLVHSEPNRLGRIEMIWVAFSLDDGGEGLCAAPVGGITLPLISASPNNLEQLKPLCRQTARFFGKPVRIAKFTKREDVEIFR